MNTKISRSLNLFHGIITAVRTESPWIDRQFLLSAVRRACKVLLAFCHTKSGNYELPSVSLTVSDFPHQSFDNRKSNLTRDIKS
jgi:hypothetical protein